MDAVSSARNARESLARALAALQSPGVPPQLMQVADPVAQAMGALHRIESTRAAALMEAAPAALDLVRQALALLQSQQGVVHPALDQATEAIAGSLGLVHQLSQAAVQAPAQPIQAVSPYAGTVMMDQSAVAPPGNAGPMTQPSQNMPYGPRPEPEPQVTFGQPASFQQPKPSAPQAPPAAAYSPPAHGFSPARTSPSPGNEARAAASPARIDAALGAHSPTNFYKGLSGNDVIESGGIFVATYQIPPIGAPLLIHVSLPGGYEFDAQAIVRWTREAPNSVPGGGGVEAPPGFGAQFTQISPEGRQLVYRYVRNREPLFHDDF